MKRLKFIFILVVNSVLVQGQQIANYVSNGGFEEVYTCSNTINSAKKWCGVDSINGGFSFLSSTCLGSVPNYGMGYQYPRNGNKFIASGFFCSTPICDSIFNRAYLKNRMKANLVAGHVYCVKFYVNIANNSTYGMDGFAAYFGDNTLDTITYYGVPLIYLSPQVQNPNNNIITDTLNWSLITGTFTATGSEKFMLIGNFKPDAMVNKVLINPGGLPVIGTDVCVDDVSCIDINLNAYAGPDTYIVPGGSVYIGREQDVGIDEACKWYKLPNTTTAIDTSAGLWVSPTATSTYMVIQNICGNIKRDTVVVSLSGVGLSELETISNSIKLFPNPTADNLTISFSSSSSADMRKISIINSLGQTIREEDIEIKNNSFTLQTSDLDNGIYQVHFKTKAGTVTKQFVKN